MGVEAKSVDRNKVAPWGKKRLWYSKNFFLAQNAWNVVRNWCLYWRFTPWPLILPQIYGFGSKNAELTTLRFPRIGRNDNYWNFTNIYEQILFFCVTLGGLQFCSPKNQLYLMYLLQNIKVVILCFGRKGGLSIQRFGTPNGLFLEVWGLKE